MSPQSSWLRSVTSGLTSKPDPGTKAERRATQDVIDRETDGRQEHEQATRRGERCALIADQVIDQLRARGQHVVVPTVTGPVRIEDREVRALFIGALIEALYPGVAVDVPRLR